MQATVRIGERIPALELEALCDGEVRLVDLAERGGRWLLLVFYPRDFSFVCPTELAALAGRHDELAEIGADVMSVSTDTVYTHKAWRDVSPSVARGTFPMLSDPAGALCRAFGTLIEAEGVSQRASAIVDPEGVLRAFEIHDNSIGRGVDELVRKLRAAAFVRANEGEVCPAEWQPGQPALTPSLALVGVI